MTKNVLMVGWHPSAVDYSKYPGLTAQMLADGISAEEAALAQEGFTARTEYIHSVDTAADQLTNALKDTVFDVVLIGAGVRRNDDHFLTFEALVNVVHEHAPAARIAFNSSPKDSADAVRRWV
jgi:hypothetical protein